MMLFVELQYFDRETLTRLRWKMLADATDDVRWIEWTPELIRLCERPDLTLIGPQYLSWIEVAKLANLATGQQVVLVGSSEVTLGLQVLPLDFAMHELLAYIPGSALKKGSTDRRGWRPLQESKPRLQEHHADGDCMNHDGLSSIHTCPPWCAG